MSRKAVLHAGSGQSGVLPEGFQNGEWQEVRLDLDRRTVPDIVGSVLDIPRADGVFDAVYCAHTLEHLHWHEVGIALKEFRRVLCDEGFCVIVCPDLEAIALLIVRGSIELTVMESLAGPITPLDMLYGHRPSIANGQPLMAHHTGFTVPTLQRAMQNAGFRSVQCGTGQMYDLYGVGYVQDRGELAKTLGGGSQETGQTARLPAENGAV